MEFEVVLESVTPLVMGRLGVRIPSAVKTKVAQLGRAALTGSRVPLEIGLGVVEEIGYIFSPNLRNCGFESRPTSRYNSR